MNKIVWITADYFLDVDIKPIQLLSKIYYIEWQIISNQQNRRFDENYLYKFIFSKDINITYHQVNFRFRSLKFIPFYWSLCKKIKNINCELVYFNLTGFPYFAFVGALLLDKDKTLMAIHQAISHEGMRYRKFYDLYLFFLYRWFKHFNFFSKSQYEIFARNNYEKIVSIVPLGLKDFGSSNATLPEDRIVFLNFGSIIKNKNIDLLIKAACNIYEKGIKGFLIKIVGHCDDWSQYEALLKFPEIFNLRIETIPNEDIPDLFCSAHYLVLPYSAVSQSGVLKIAYYYNVPVITSDLDEFKNEIEDNITGYLFSRSEIKSLENTMIKAILDHKIMYQKLKMNQLQYVMDNFSDIQLRERYCSMFNSMIL